MSHQGTRIQQNKALPRIPKLFFGQDKKKIVVECLGAPMFPQLFMIKIKIFSSAVQMWYCGTVVMWVFSCVFLTDQGSLG